LRSTTHVQKQPWGESKERIFGAHNAKKSARWCLNYLAHPKDGNLGVDFFPFIHTSDIDAKNC